MAQKNRESTKCFECQNAVPSKTRGCSWSRSLVPVKGWDAVQTRIYYENGRNACSYSVISCPEFIPDAPRKPVCY